MGDPSWLAAHKPDCQKNTNTMVQKLAYKIILVGEAGVGKTSIFSRARHPKSKPHELQTSASIGVDTCTRTVCTRYGDVTMTLWDTAGAEQYRTLTRNYYRNTHAVILVFSLDCPPSLYALPGWQHDVLESSPAAVHFLIGNKSDLPREVKDQSMQCFADSHNCQAAFLTSAKTGEGVEAALHNICEHLLVQSQQHSKAHRDRLWLQGSGMLVHGHNQGKHAVKCCTFT